MFLQVGVLDEGLLTLETLEGLQAQMHLLVPNIRSPMPKGLATVSAAERRILRGGFLRLWLSTPSRSQVWKLFMSRHMSKEDRIGGEAPGTHGTTVRAVATVRPLVFHQ